MNSDAAVITLSGVSGWERGGEEWVGESGGEESGGERRIGEIGAGPGGEGREAEGDSSLRSTLSFIPPFPGWLVERVRILIRWVELQNSGCL